MKKLLPLALALMLLLAACVQPSAERISDEELARLREEYPYNDKWGGIDFSIWMEHFEEVKPEQYSYHAVVAVTLGEKWTESYGNLYCEGAVRQVLWGGKDLRAEDPILLSFGSIGAATQMDVKHSFSLGETYVCFLSRHEDEETGVLHYPTGKRTAYRLLEGDVLLSICSEPGIDECSGMYLPAFQKLVIKTLGSPDAKAEP